MDETYSVLYLEDYPLDQKLVRDALEREHGGFSLTIVSSREALEVQLSEKNYDAVLSDFNIMGFEGLEVIDIVREQQPGTPVIIVTGTGSEQVAVEAMKRGAADYVIKTPLHIRKLPQTILANMEKFRLRQSKEAAEQALKNQVSFLQTLIDTIPSPVFYKDRQGLYTGCNRAFEQFVGKSRGEIIGKTVSDIGPPEITDKYRQMDRLLYDKPGTQTYEWFMQNAAGERRNVLFNKATFPGPDGPPEGIVGIITDVTDDKKAAEALLLSEERFRSIAESPLDAIMIMDSDFKIVYWSPGAENMLGYSSQEVRGRTPEFLLPEQFRDKDLQAQEHYKKTGKSAFISRRTIESEWRKKSGEEFSIEMSVAAWSIGEHNYFSSISRDITARKLAEKEIRETRDFLDNIYRTSPDIILVTDRKGTIISANPAAEEALGYSLEELVGQSTGMLLPDDDVHRRRMYEMLEIFRDQGEVSNYELRVKTKTGSIRSFESNAVILRDSSGQETGTLSVMRDTTERREIEEVLRQSQKLESIGTLAGGIAHDFNNILGAIIGFTEMSFDELGKDHPVRYNLEQILKSGMRARDLVKQILAFSRKGFKEKKRVQIQTIITEVLQLLRSTIPTTIDIQQQIEHEPLTIVADPTQIHQVLMNLASNSADAMRDRGGVLEISLKRREVSKKEASARHDILPGPYAALTVRDTGEGILPDIADKIFEPFFTTKEREAGTGMGLSVVHGIVKAHRGDIQLESSPGRGTTFDILLPLAVEESGRSPGKNHAPASPPGGSESLLFVDDEEMLIRVGVRLLETLGYRVDAYRSSLEAYEAFKQNPQRYDLLITDQTMPHMTGFELGKKIISIRPDIPVVLCTGYSETVSDTRALGSGIKAFVMKPLNRQELAKTIRKVLDDR